MGLLMWYGSSRHYDLSTFPNAQMYYPAAGVMLGVLFTQKGMRWFQGCFYIFELCDSNIGSGGSVIGDSALCNGIFIWECQFHCGR